MHAKRHPEPKGLPAGLRGTPHEQTDFKKTLKFTWEKLSAMKFAVAGSLQRAFKKYNFAVILAVNFTCCSFFVKPHSGYDVCQISLQVKNIGIGGVIGLRWEQLHSERLLA